MAVRLVGACGGVVSGPLSDAGVTTVTLFDDSDRCPTVSRAITQISYCDAGQMFKVMVAVVTFPTLTLDRRSSNLRA